MDQTGLGLTTDQAVLLGKLLPNFDYPDRFCRFCDAKMQLEQAVHIDPPSDFKAVYFCMNRKCGCFDLEARKAFCLIYYSSDRAEQLLYSSRIWMPVEKKD